MADSNVRIVREFLEALGFSVLTNRKFQLQKADPPGRYSIDVVATNLRYAEPEAPLPMKLNAEHMRFLPNVIVDVKGWHGHRFVPSLITATPELFYFVSAGALQYARSVFNGAPFKSLLVISEATAVEPLWLKVEEMLKEGGIDHVVEFTTILGFLISYVEVNVNYVESETLQLLRLLKRYDLVKGLQMELPFKSRSSNPEGEE
ncbi:MAG: hypothetical protein C4520_20720 [Candidatus Abyssobacteria bacterium SURF_5]|uniref:Uncharacterized protein n=1 Tax=Abyssobacteria bacterium (strain SURF_5) TaxID=2093360 RepID=A0A3A4N9N0_ABYX5|nr:MAG: hypothetical protein C4520_20720 [Candidatus Abyssubacteria bacterium SURF_5]